MSRESIYRYIFFFQFVTDTGGKFAAGVIDTSGKFDTGIKNTSGIVANLPKVSLIPIVHLDLQISLRIFEKIRNDPKAIIRGLGEDDSRKKPEAKNLVTLSL